MGVNLLSFNKQTEFKYNSSCLVIKYKVFITHKFYKPNIIMFAFGLLLLQPNSNGLKVNEHGIKYRVNLQP